MSPIRASVNRLAGEYKIGIAALAGPQCFGDCQGVPVMTQGRLVIFFICQNIAANDMLADEDHFAALPHDAARRSLAPQQRGIFWIALAEIGCRLLWRPPVAV